MAENLIGSFDNLKFETKGIPMVYCNSASPSLSFNDIRVYLSEILPREMSATSSEKAQAVESVIEPRLCVVFSPEFAKSYAAALTLSVEKYENVFGPLRTTPTASQVKEKLGLPTT